MDEIIVVVDDVRYRGWKKFTVHNTLDAMCGSFTLEIVEFSDELVENLFPGNRVDIYIGGDQLMAGYIYTREKTVTSGSNTLTLSGRDITSDLVDCSPTVKSNYWAGAKIERIANDITKPFGIFTDVIVDDVPFSEFSIQQGETAYSAIERMCRLRGYLCITNQFGDLVITNFDERFIPDIELNTSKLEIGKNIISMTEALDYSNRFSEYFVRGQGKGDNNGIAWSKKSLNYTGKATDKGIKRYRPKVIISDSETSNATTKEQALWTARTNAARAKVYTVTVQGFRQQFTFRNAEDALWRSGAFVHLINPAWRVSRQFIISRCEYSFSEGGSLTTLTLKDPWAYRTDPNEVVS